MQLLASIFPAHVQAKENVNFPFLTLHDFQTFAYGARRSARATAIAYAPLIQENERQAWEDTYSEKNHREWFVAALKQQVMVVTSNGHVNSNLAIPKHIWDTDSTKPQISKSKSGVYLPFWQSSPPPIDRNHVNYNLLSNPAIKDMLHYVIQTGRTTLSAPMDVSSIFSRKVIASGILYDWEGNSYDDKDVDWYREQFNVPKAIFVSPVWDAYVQGALVRGVIVSAFRWDDFLTNVRIGSVLFCSVCFFSYRVPRCFKL